MAIIRDTSVCTCGHIFSGHKPIARTPATLPDQLTGPCTVNLGVVFDRGRDLRDTRGACPCQFFTLDGEATAGQLRSAEYARANARRRRKRLG